MERVKVTDTTYKSYLSRERKLSTVGRIVRALGRMVGLWAPFELEFQSKQTEVLLEETHRDGERSQVLAHHAQSHVQSVLNLWSVP